MGQWPVSHVPDSQALAGKERGRPASKELTQFCLYLTREKGINQTLSEQLTAPGEGQGLWEDKHVQSGPPHFPVRESRPLLGLRSLTWPRWAHTFLKGYVAIQPRTPNA